LKYFADTEVAYPKLKLGKNEKLNLHGLSVGGFSILVQAMERKKRTITVNETATLLSLRFKSREMQRGWCAECAAEVTWIELPMVIQLLDFSTFAEKSVVHLSAGRVCSRSLTTYLNNLNKEKGP
jgi:hypothetical protein